ncbi:hypothetical protein D3C87_1659340 [compost metagenome]
MVARKIEGLLVNRSSDDAADCARFGIPHRFFNETESGVSGNRRQRAPWQRRTLHRQIDHIPSKIDVDAKRAPRRFQRCKVAINPRCFPIRGGHFRKRADGDFRADAAGVTHGDTNDVAHPILPSLASAQPGASRTYLIARR